MNNERLLKQIVTASIVGIRERRKTTENIDWRGCRGSEDSGSNKLLCRLARDRKVEDRTGSQGSQQTVALEGEEEDDY